MPRIILLAMAALGLAACSNPSVLMTDGQGHFARCAASGWGIVGSLRSNSAVGSCVDDFERLGYRRVSE